MNRESPVFSLLKYSKFIEICTQPYELLCSQTHVRHDRSQNILHFPLITTMHTDDSGKTLTYSIAQFGNLSYERLKLFRNAR